MPICHISTLARQFSPPRQNKFTPPPPHLHDPSKAPFFLPLIFFLSSPTGENLGKNMVKTWVELGKNMVRIYQGVSVG